MTNRTYDILKEIALVWLPALGALYWGLANTWGLPYAEEVVGTVAVLDTFLGAVLHLSNKKYMEGKDSE